MRILRGMTSVVRIIERGRRGRLCRFGRFVPFTLHAAFDAEDVSSATAELLSRSR